MDLLEAQIVLNYLRRKKLTKTLRVYQAENQSLLKHAKSVESLPTLQSLLSTELSAEKAHLYLKVLLDDYDKIKGESASKSGSRRQESKAVAAGFDSKLETMAAGKRKRLEERICGIQPETPSLENLDVDAALDFLYKQT